MIEQDLPDRLESPFAEGAWAVRTPQARSYTFRGEEFAAVSWGWECEQTGRRFTTTSSDQALYESVQQLWRERHGVPSPAGLVALREQYGLSARQFSKLLGMGPNQYSRYEAGELPSKSSAVLLMLVASPAGLRELIHRRADVLKSTLAARLQVLVAAEPVSLSELEVGASGVLSRSQMPYEPANAVLRPALSGAADEAVASVAYSLESTDDLDVY